MTKTFSFKDRESFIERMKLETFDLLIIGGGINGAGVARDASSRGMKVALVEARDFAEGTSSRSSKLIHGGIRYLENLDFHLVFEALSERSTLFEIAPHLVHPLRFMIPMYKGSRVSPFKMGLGMCLYDILALFQSPQMHEYLNFKETMLKMPMLKSEGLKGSFLYSDAYMDDDRLVLETLRSANELGALSVNFVKAIKPMKSKTGSLEGFECKNNLNDEVFKIKAKHIVSTLGPWTDELGTKLFSDWKKIMRPSKGIHLSFRREDIPLSTAVVMGAEERIVFGIPRKDTVIVGTTDTDYNSDLNNVHTELKDVEYLLSVVKGYFPGAKLTKENILSSYAGVRPLVDDGSQSEGKTSREHVIVTDKINFTYVAGGKYTTYRKMAEETVDSALNLFSVEDKVRFNRSETKTPINLLSTRDKNREINYRSAELSGDFKFSLKYVNRFIQRHGGEAEVLLKKSLKYQDLKEEERYWVTDLVHAVDTTMCFQLVDFYLRRSPLMLTHKDHGLAFQSILGDHLEAKLGFNIKNKEEMRRDIERHIALEMGWR